VLAEEEGVEPLGEILQAGAVVVVALQPAGVGVGRGCWSKPNSLAMS
jgi:hypothetical protein